MLSKDIRESLIKALQNPELYEAHAAEIHVVGRAAYEVDTISFESDSFLLDSNEHNRPLYLEGILNRKPVKRILVDPGSAVNLLPLRTLRKVGHQPRDLEAANCIIQGFNQRGQEAMGTIRLTLKLGDWFTRVKFYVIDADTSYWALLGRPWIHQNGVVPSTLHQC